MPPWWRKKISLAKRRGRNISCLQCGAEVYQQRSEVRKYCSRKCLTDYWVRTGVMRGENNPSWLGGKYSKQVRQRIRRTVLLRDNYTCVSCGLEDRTPGFLDIDHTLEVCDRPDLKDDVSNCKTLCPNCHRRKTIESIRSRRANKPK